MKIYVDTDEFHLRAPGSERNYCGTPFYELTRKIEVSKSRVKHTHVCDICYEGYSKRIALEEAIDNLS